VAAVVAGAAGIVAGPGNAAPAPKANKASHVRKEAKFKHPTLKHGLLTIEGTKGSDRIALRLKAGQSGILQVDVRDDGSADFSFKREQIAKVAVNAGPATTACVSTSATGSSPTGSLTLSANGNRLRFFRDLGTITMDTHGVERVDFNALGGADTITVNDLTGTDVKCVNTDLAATGGGGLRPGAPPKLRSSPIDSPSRVRVRVAALGGAA